MPDKIRSYAELRELIRVSLRIQNPDWVAPNGDSPVCDSYEARFAELLGLSERRAFPLAAIHSSPVSASLSRGFEERTDSGYKLRESHGWVRKIRMPNLLPLEGQPAIETCSLKNPEGVFQGDFPVANLNVLVSQSRLEVGDGVLDIDGTHPGTNIRPHLRNGFTRNANRVVHIPEDPDVRVVRRFDCPTQARGHNPIVVSLDENIYSALRSIVSQSVQTFSGPSDRRGVGDADGHLPAKNPDIPALQIRGDIDMALAKLKARLKLFRFRDHHHGGRQNHARREPGLLQAVPRVGQRLGKNSGTFVRSNWPPIPRKATPS